MSKIDEMLKNEKVEWRKLGEVCDIKRGRVISKSYLEQHIGNYPVYSSQTRNDGEIGRINTYDFNGEYTTWTTDGAYAGTIFYRSGKFSITNICGLIQPKNRKDLLVKFITYWLQIKAKKYVKDGSGNPKLMSNVVSNIYIPIPSIETQEKIVEILDKFTNYVTELQAELQFRTKQYEYYRDMLLSEDYLNKISEKIDKFENNKYKITTVELGSIVEIKNGKDWKSLSTGTIPVYGSGGNMGIYVDKYAYNKPTVLIPRKGSIENIFYLEEPFWNVDTIFYTQIDEGKIIPKYFYYFMQNYDLKSLSTDSTRPSLTQQIVNKIKIKLPPIEIQNKVVKVLDKFQTLLEDTKGLLPTEIEQRRKQYEYYREKLLTFDADCGSQSVSQLISNSFFRILAEAADFVSVDINNNIDWKTLASIGSFENGKGMPKTLFDEQGSIGLNTEYDIKKVLLKDIARYSTKRITAKFLNKSNYVGVDNLSKNKLGKVESEYVPTEGSFIGFGSGDILIGNIRPYLRKIWLANVEGGTNGDVLAISIKEDCDRKILPKFLYQILSSEKFFEYDIKFSKGAKMPRGNKDKVMNYEFILPSIPVQEHIVSILDKFDTLVNDIKNGLPKEIELRQKQYEYFREKLLNFRK